MWTPTFPGLLPGKNRVVCSGFGGKRIPRNVTSRGAWGGLAWRPCISQLVRVKHNLGGQMVRPHSLQCIPTLSNTQNPLLTQHILYLQTEPSGTGEQKEALSSPSVLPHKCPIQGISQYRQRLFFWLCITLPHDKCACWEALRLAHPFNDWNESCHLMSNLYGALGKRYAEKRNRNTQKVASGSRSIAWDHCYAVPLSFSPKPDCLELSLLLKYNAKRTTYSALSNVLIQSALQSI